MTIEELESLPRNWISAKEAAEVLGISTKTFYKYLKTGKFTFQNYDVGKKVKILKEPFIDYLRGKA